MGIVKKTPRNPYENKRFQDEITSNEKRTEMMSGTGMENIKFAQVSMDKSLKEILNPPRNRVFMWIKGRYNA